MTVSKTFKGLLLGLALLLAASVFAADKGALQLTDVASVGGKRLTAGDYGLKWDGGGPTVQLTILKGNKVVATIPARVVNLDHPSAHNEAVVNTNGDGSRALAEIRFSGRKYVLAIGEDAGAPSASGGGSSR